jgi:hypothetical protein
MFNVSEICLDDEVDWGWSDDVNGSRDELLLLDRSMRRRRIAGTVEGRVVAGTDEVRGPGGKNHALFVVLVFRISRWV